ncbi:hypothetical protein [Pseudodonghicola xiamenensis]|uniref:Uncharacterized protein n=1 Tax=Pseudodonghicola xiamenensis TaxID=337702 RepID=A0A8J3H6C1_9RHOB|nr:hypothetical protein [Pseudodonghicola xiamenensis]GHG84604.1 hypothetical protein GCM10010961_10940 [Pseudodonghicola xiamenensis]
MSFIRPEVKAGLHRWREALIGVGVVLLGLYWALGVGGFLGWIGWLLLPAGAGIAVIGLQRARFRAEGRGPGVVMITEGEITYMGPLSGGSVSVQDLERLVLDPVSSPTLWVLEQPGLPVLHIPVNAEGAGDLFDVFNALPGLKTERMLAELNGKSRHPVVIWERHPSRPAYQRLH